MRPTPFPAVVDAGAADAEIASLVETLHRTEQRLEELTAGDVDTVADASGRPFMLPRAKERLRRGEAVTQAAILNALPDHIALLDADGIIVSVNDAWRRFGDEMSLGLPDHGIGSSYLAPCDRAARRGSLQASRVAEGIRAVLAGTAPRFTADYTCDGPDGQRWFVLTATPLVAGRPGGVIVMHADVSERTRAGMSTRQTTALLQAVVDGTPDLVFVTDLAQRYLLCNEAFARFLGGTVAEILGRRGDQLFDAEQAASAAASDRAVLLSQAASTSESTLNGAAGARRFLHWKAPYRDDAGRTIGVIGIARDVTADRQLTADLESERARLVAVQEVAKIGSWSFDPAAGTYDWSAQMHRVSETDPSRFVPTIESVRALIHPDDLAAVLAVTARSLHEPSSNLRLEHRVGGPGAAEKIVEQRFQVSFDDAGRPLRVRGTSQDITERRLAERELRESQAMLSMSGRLARVGAWSVELPELRVTWSESLAAIHDEASGFSPTVEQALAYYAPEHVGAVAAAFEHCVGEGIAFDLEAEIVTAHGRRIWVRTIGEAVRDGQGAIRRVQGALQDLTERKQAEEDMRRMALRLTDTLESISDGFLTVDRDWRVTYANGQAQRLLRAPGRELPGALIWDVFAEATGSELERGFRAAMAGRQGAAFKTVYGRAGGWFGIDGYATEEGVSVYFRDDTAPRAERQRLALLEASVSQLNDIVMITEPQPPPLNSRRIVFVNDAFVRITGHARADVLGRSPRLLAGTLTDAAALAAMDAALGRFETVHTELVNYRKDGSWFWNELDVAPLGVAGDVCSHFVVIGRDITERKRDKDALERLNADLESRVAVRTAELDLARQHAERANQGKSSFLATMSHEIRTPMNGVIGMIDVLEQGRLHGSQVEIVKTIRESAHMLLSVVDDVLDFSKIEAGQFQIDSEPMDVAVVVEGVCDGLAHSAAAQGVSLRVFADPALPAQALGDAARLRQVLVNLVGNAIKFSGGTGRAGQVRVRAVPATSDDGEAGIRIDIRDNGIGMDDDTLARLFTPFTQAESGTTRRFGGTGLGLSISQRLAGLMGGVIVVASSPGLGSTFSVRLALGALPGGAPPAAAASSLDGLSCLVFGAAEGSAADLAAYLGDAGASVCHVDAAAGIAPWVKRCPPGRGVVVVVDAGAHAGRLIATCRASFAERAAFRAGFVVVEAGRQPPSRGDSSDVRRVDSEALRRGTLLVAVAEAAGRHAPDPEPSRPQDLETLPMPLDDGANGGAPRTVLIAEDNEINQRVLRKQLALLGLASDVAATGREALAQLQRRDYSLLLTDLHMPLMDGYELTAAIRAAEAGTRHLPIVALTANAVKGEAKRCRDIGMDDYMTKPVQLKNLKTMLDRWLPPRPTEAVAVAAVGQGGAITAPAAGLAAAADLDVLAALVGDDPAVIADMLKAFRSSAARSSAEIRRALGAGDSTAAASAAHMLKSGARSLGAERLAEVCVDIEGARDRRHPAGVPTLLARFDTEMNALEQFLDQPRRPDHARAT